MGQTRAILVAALTTLVVLGGPATALGNSYRVIYNFKGSADGWGPMGVPAVAKNGDLYGVTVGGGTSNLGTVFKVTAPQTRGGAWKKTVLYNFTSGEAEILTSLVMGKDGTLYGAGYNENYPGFIFRLKPPVGGDGSDGDWQYDVLYTFSNDSGGIFVDGIALDAKGDIYGTTEYGGDLSCGDGIGCGTVFELQRPTKRGGQWVHSVLYMFGQGGNEDAIEPFAGVTLNKEGTIYGTTDGGGIYDYGTVYRLNPPTQKGGTWTEAVLYSFEPGTNMGAHPDGPVTFDEFGNMYGTTTLGGDLNCSGGYGCGVVFELSPQEGGTWTYTNLYSFQGGDDGAEPKSRLVFDGRGNLYGTTSAGYGGVAGSAFRLAPPADGGGWTETTLYTFTTDRNGDGDGLAWGKWHSLYGVAYLDGKYQAGTVFELQP
jgi:uncharacterized repeat protein (TIGR03803 family)